MKRFTPRILAAAWLTTTLLAAGRTTQPLDGTWRIADSRSATELPDTFPATVRVPGLANQARPSFPDVDQFISRENLANRIRSKLAPAEWLTNYWTGKVDQNRNYFWYTRTFRAPDRREIARLKINKAQFGTAVWLNGMKLGEYAGCFTASYFNLDRAIHWNARNTLVVRIGAHPAVLPDNYPTGSDFEKLRWTPGIYDSVALIFCDNPVIESVQVAPRLANNEAIVQTRLRNAGTTAVVASLTQTVRTWKDPKFVARADPESVSLEPGEQKVVTRTMAIPEAHYWSPEDPFLYVLETSTGGDSLVTRFGMREFRFDAATQRAYLNNQVYYLRGSNITLHRFFEDPLCGDLPWREAWVRRLLGEIPHQMHWNYFRFCIGPVPDRWLEICDEVGLLVQNEFFVWTGGPGWYPGYSRTYDPDEMIRQYRDWMRDDWNHPSVAVWDANNETSNEMFGTRIIPAVRPLDLSDRPWENSYNRPAAPNDPVEYHPYLMSSGYFGKLKFKMTDLETMDGRAKPGELPSDTNPPLINEYGWLWLNRDGSPTRLTTNVYAQLMGTNVTARERLDLYAYLLAAKTEFWRAHRHFAGIVHFVYLTCSYPGVYTADHFQDVRKLTLDPAFKDYVGQAFQPLGVYVDFFQPQLAAGARRNFRVMLINDRDRAAAGTLILRLENANGRTVREVERQFSMDPLSQASMELPFAVPANLSGRHTLKAIARTDDRSFGKPTLCRRWVTISTDQ